MKILKILEKIFKLRAYFTTIKRITNPICTPITKQISIQIKWFQRDQSTLNAISVKVKLKILICIKNSNSKLAFINIQPIFNQLTQHQTK